MKNKTEKLSLRKFKVVNFYVLNSILGGNPTTNQSTLSRTSLDNTGTTSPPTVVSTNPNCK